MTDDQGIDGLGLTRRQALAAAAALCGLGAVATTGVGVAQASGTLPVQLSKFPALSKVGGAAVVGSLNGIPVAVVRTARNRYIALDRRCPHRGGVVGQSGNGWECPLHFSRFALDGKKISGVTPSGLRRLRARLSGGTLTITA